MKQNCAGYWVLCWQSSLSIVNMSSTSFCLPWFLVRNLLLILLRIPWTWQAISLSYFQDFLFNLSFWYFDYDVSRCEKSLSLFYLLLFQGFLMCKLKVFIEFGNSWQLFPQAFLFFSPTGTANISMFMCFMVATVCWFFILHLSVSQTR